MLMLEEQRKLKYNIYISDMLKNIAEKAYALCGQSIGFERYSDYIRRGEKTEEKAPEEKLREIVSAAGIELKEGGVTYGRI